MSRQFFFALIMTSATVIIFNFVVGKYFVSNDETVYSGQGYTVPTKEDLIRPMSRDIDFLDDAKTVEEKILIETPLCNYSFSNHGGVITGMEFKNYTGKNKTHLKTIESESNEDGAFLLALDEKTPLDYKKIAQEESESVIKVVYKGTDLSGCEIYKEYYINKDSYKIDLHLKIKPGSKPVRPRIFVTGPYVAEVDKNSQDGFVFNKKSSKFDFVTDFKDSAWATPSIFGVQDKYFANMIVKDESNFIQRAYYKVSSTDKLTAVYEGPELTSEKDVKMSFYMGPKELKDLTDVDPVLEGVLNFGWFSRFCKFLLKLLEYIHEYFTNYGFAIVILTLVLSLPLAPLSIIGSASMERHQKLQPQIARIKQKYKDDVTMQNREIMLFYKERNISPAGQLVGCLPFVLYIPIMFSLLNVLRNYIGLYQAPFILWISDLSAKDPYYVLPVLVGALAIWQHKLIPTKDDKQRMMGMFMPLITTAIFANFASGVVLFWVMRSFITVGETYYRKAFMKK